MELQNGQYRAKLQGTLPVEGVETRRGTYPEMVEGIVRHPEESGITVSMRSLPPSHLVTY